MSSRFDNRRLARDEKLASAASATLAFSAATRLERRAPLPRLIGLTPEMLVAVTKALHESWEWRGKEGLKERSRNNRLDEPQLVEKRVSLFPCGEFQRYFARMLVLLESDNRQHQVLIEGVAGDVRAGQAILHKLQPNSGER